MVRDGTMRRRVAYVAIAASALYALAYLGVWAGQGDARNDFLIFWSAGKWLAERGLTPPLYDLDVFHAFQETLAGPLSRFYPLPYPPTLAPLLMPLALLPQAWANAVFIAATLIVFLLLVGAGRWRRIVALLSAPATFAVVVIGQIAFLSSGLLIGGLRQVGKWPVLAGVLLGLLSVKPQIGLLVPVALVAFRAWRAFAAAVVVTLLLPIPSLVTGGADVWSAWLHLMPQIAEHLAGGTDDAVQMMIAPASALLTLGVPLPIAELVQIPISLAVAAVVYVACRRSGPSEIAVAMIGVGTLIGTPYAWFYDLLIAAWAVVVVAEAGIRHGFRRWELPVLALAWVLPILAIGRVLPVVQPLALIALFAVLVRRVTEPESAWQATASSSTRVSGRGTAA